MGDKRKPSAHQKQVRFFVFFFGTIMITAVIAMLIFLNRPIGGFHHFH
jgi:hypothetical protein